MSFALSQRAFKVRFSTLRALLMASTALMTGACAQQGSLPSLTSSPMQDEASIVTSSTPNAKPGSPEQVRVELQKATEYWGKTYAKNPGDAQAAYNYARNLKALGDKQQALAVLQAAASSNPGHRGILGEYGRLALEFDQVSLAQSLLERADDPAKPDWRIVSARGTAMAKQGLYRDAITFYQRAMQLAPDQPSIMSNLALAYTMEGHPDKAEPLMRRAAAARDADQRVNQNLSLILGLQGKYDEAKLTALHSVPAESASENIDYVRSIVKAAPKPLTTKEKKTTQEKTPEWSVSVVATK